MKLVVGLGNPGLRYENTRHNVGWMAIDHYAQEKGIALKFEPAFSGIIGTVNLLGKKAILLKPTTFMNLSGESVIKVLNYYKIDVEDMLVISDDIDSTFSRVRLRAKGSSGGHNGHKNIMAHLHTEEYKRIKIGIGRDENINTIDWVLKKFSKEELDELELTFQKTTNAINDFINEVDFEQIASKYSENK